jgi:hypothetical protein
MRSAASLTPNRSQSNCAIENPEKLFDRGMLILIDCPIDFSKRAFLQRWIAVEISFSFTKRPTSLIVIYDAHQVCFFDPASRNALDASRLSNDHR